MGILSTDDRFSVAAANSTMPAIRLQLHLHVNLSWLLFFRVDKLDGLTCFDSMFRCFSCQ